MGCPHRKLPALCRAALWVTLAAAAWTLISTTILVMWAAAKYLA